MRDPHFAIDDSTRSRSPLLNHGSALRSDGLDRCIEPAIEPMLRLRLDCTAVKHQVGLRSRDDRFAPVKVSPEPDPVVWVIDDDSELRDSLGRLLRSVGLSVQLFASVRDCLTAARPDGPSCLVLDIRMPGQSGLEFQREMAASDIQLPIIFMTGHGDIPMTVQAMKGGAVDFLTKPFRDQDLLDAIARGLAHDRARRQSEENLVALRARFEALTPREREIMIHVVKGRLSKQIAGDIGVSEVTVKVHRSNMMHKMKVTSLLELARIADKLNLI